LYDLISAAGGFSPTAGRRVSIIRQRSQVSPITVNLPRNLADDLQDNIEIYPGDTITVRPALWEENNVVLQRAMALGGVAARLN